MRYILIVCRPFFWQILWSDFVRRFCPQNLLSTFIEPFAKPTHPRLLGTNQCSSARLINYRLQAGPCPAEWIWSNPFCQDSPYFLGAVCIKTNIGFLVGQTMQDYILLDYPAETTLIMETTVPTTTRDPSTEDNTE
jgi:hypothetical protein